MSEDGGVDLKTLVGGTTRLEAAALKARASYL